ncbi:hypothetical protein N0V90_007434 [Kalmusia sp. IMI 367209]|nr:hypothetical protein N0V90_007434 [Kalmusia sp. IMI 367209]
MYRCLSYVWGEPEHTRQILIDGQRFQVQQNLYDFLDMARSKTRRIGPLWVDALCIDQDNTAERNHQVQQMGEVYSKAAEVLIWLGKDPNYAATLRAVGLARSTFRMRFVEVSTAYDEKLFSDVYWNRAWFRPKKGTRTNSSIFSFLWVVQEIVLACKLSVLAGDEEIAWDTLFRNIPALGLEHVLSDSPFARFQYKDEYRSKDRALLLLLERYQEKECTLLCDRVYSLLSLCGPGKDLQVDYQVSELDLAYQVLDACQEYLCLYYFALIGGTLGLDRLDRIPPASAKSYPYLEIVIPTHHYYYDRRRRRDVIKITRYRSNGYTGPKKSFLITCDNWTWRPEDAPTYKLKSPSLYTSISAASKHSITSW